MELKMPELSHINVRDKEYLTVHMCAYHNLECGGQEYTDEPELTDGWCVFILKRHEDTGIVDDIDYFEWDFKEKDPAED